LSAEEEGKEGLFTGLIQDIGIVQTVERSKGGMRLTIATRLDLSRIRVGDSVAVDGACLTVIKKAEESFAVEVSAETLQRTTLGRMQSGQAVNLEESLRLSDPLGGHLVSGHVDGTGQILRILAEGNASRYHFGFPEPMGRYLIEKGSVAVDGISLTIAALDDRGFHAVVLPYTARSTTLGRKKVGDSVNLENDLIAKYVEKFVRLPEDFPKAKKSIDATFLAEHGFMK
jgi:riboflavin synthase